MVYRYTCPETGCQQSQFYIGYTTPTLKQQRALHDDFPAILLKKYNEVFKMPLYLVWRRTVGSLETPCSLKTSFITPIPKGGSRKKKKKNYRPVSLVSHIINVFERVLVRKYLTTLKLKVH